VPDLGIHPRHQVLGRDVRLLLGLDASHDHHPLLPHILPRLLLQQPHCSQGEFRDQADAEWRVIRGPLRGHHDTPYRRPMAVRPIGHACGVFDVFSYF
jgi:hypothetical protein